MRNLIAAVVLAAAAACTATTAAGQACAPRAALIEQLGAKYHETLTGGGLRNNQQVLEIWTAPETGTWTALLTSASGVSCILATGTHWHQQTPVAPAKDEAG